MKLQLRRALAGVAFVGVGLLGLTACGGPPAAPTDVTTDVDRQRAAFLVSDPVLKSAVEPPVVRPGVAHSDKLGWDRTEVTAEIYLSSGLAGPPPETVEHEMAAATTILRQGGWTIHWEMCLPPPVISLSGEVDEDPIPMQVPRIDGHEWLASGYKIVDGVSYWVLVVGVRQKEGNSFIDILLRAPNARDDANLFATTAPTPLATDKTCAEDNQVSPDIEQAGTPTQIRDWWPFPAQTRTRDPHQV